MALYYKKKIFESNAIDCIALWNDLKRGNREAFIQIYNKHVNDLIRYGCQLVSNKTFVEDVVHDLFVSIWEKRKELADVYNIKFYLLSATRRMLLRRVKKERLLVSTPSKQDAPFEMVPSYIDQKIERQEEKERHKKIKTVINGLTERQREIIYLKFYQNLSYKQISEMLDLDQKYTYNLAARAFAGFKEKFGILAIVIGILTETGSRTFY